MNNARVGLYVLLARKSPLAVVFRRGPSKQVLALLWDTSNDVIQPGQWFNGRIYERRCDLSPSGGKLIYFAAKYVPPFGTWTAVSRPPYLTALALWPKEDAWGGGGLFQNERTIQLNHRPMEMSVGPDVRLPKSIVVEPFGTRPGWGEDDPILSARMMRDGWVLQHPGVVKEHKFGAKVHWTFSENQVWTKTRGDHAIEMRLLGIHEREGPWYVIEHRLLDASGAEIFDFGRSDWSDWSKNGDALVARDGRLYRMSARLSDVGNLREVADLRDLKFSNAEAPADARRWSGKLTVVP
jgi:hypothetical protein